MVFTIFFFNLDPHANCNLKTDNKVQLRKTIFWRETKKQSHNKHHKINSNYFYYLENNTNNLNSTDVPIVENNPNDNNPLSVNPYSAYSHNETDHKQHKNHDQNSIEKESLTKHYHENKHENQSESNHHENHEKNHNEINTQENEHLTQTDSKSDSQAHNYDNVRSDSQEDSQDEHSHHEHHNENHDAETQKDEGQAQNNNQNHAQTDSQENNQGEHSHHEHHNEHHNENHDAETQKDEGQAQNNNQDHAQTDSQENNQGEHSHHEHHNEHHNENHDAETQKDEGQAQTNNKEFSQTESQEDNQGEHSHHEHHKEHHDAETQGDEGQTPSSSQAVITNPTLLNKYTSIDDKEPTILRENIQLVQKSNLKCFDTCVEKCNKTYFGKEQEITSCAIDTCKCTREQYLNFKQTLIKTDKPKSSKSLSMMLIDVFIIVSMLSLAMSSGFIIMSFSKKDNLELISDNDRNDYDSINLSLSQDLYEEKLINAKLFENYELMSTGEDCQDKEISVRDF